MLKNDIITKEKIGSVYMRVEGTDINLIFKLYLQGRTIKEIADAFCIKNHKKVSDSINYYFKEHPSIKYEYRKERIKNIPNEKIYLLINQGLSYIKIADMYSISESTVKLKLNQYYKENNIPFEKNDKESIKNNSKMSLPMDEIIEKFKNGKTISNLAKEYNISASTMSSHLRDILSENEMILIINKNRHTKKSWFTQEELFNVRKLYESGEYTKNEIANSFNISLVILNSILKDEYKKIGKKDIPKIVSEKTLITFINVDKYNKNQLLKYADDNNFVIPEKLLKKYFKDDINIEKIRKFVIDKIVKNPIDENSQKEIFNNYNIASLLKSKGYNDKYQAVAILYSLPKITDIKIDEINKILEDKTDLIEAIELLNMEEDNNKKLLENDFAKIVKIAEYIEKIKKDTLNGIQCSINDYRKYYEISKNTRLRSDFDLVIYENKKLLYNKDEQK